MRRTSAAVLFLLTDLFHLAQKQNGYNFVERHNIHTHGRQRKREGKKHRVTLSPYVKFISTVDVNRIVREGMQVSLSAPYFSCYFTYSGFHVGHGYNIRRQNSMCDCMANARACKNLRSSSRVVTNEASHPTVLYNVSCDT